MAKAYPVFRFSLQHNFNLHSNGVGIEIFGDGLWKPTLFEQEKSKILK